MPEEVRRYCVCLWAMSLVVLLSVGCNSKYKSTVRGTVRLDGTPVHHGNIAFEPRGGGKMATSEIHDGGQYELRSNSDTGLAPGEYRVLVFVREKVPMPEGGGLPMPGKLLIPEKYTRSSTSGLAYTVEPGANEIDVELSSE